MVRAKFRVESVTNSADSSSVKLWHVTGGSEENTEFFKYTPSGAIELNTINKEAAQQFEPGKEYYVDFTAAD